MGHQLAERSRAPTQHARKLDRCACGGTCGCTEREDEELHRLLRQRSPAAIIALQRAVGNRAVTAALGVERRLQRDEIKRPRCGPGTDNPFCLPIPSLDEPCTPFPTLQQAEAHWDHLSTVIPSGAAAATGCSEVKPVWEAYFNRTSKPFAFSNPASCVVKAAKTDRDGSQAANAAANAVWEEIKDNLPALLREVTLTPFSLDGKIGILRKAVANAITPKAAARELHPTIVYNNPFNAAANISGDVGRGNEGSDIFGADDRIIQGPVVVEVNSVDPDGTMNGEVRWAPHVHVKDTVDFCPGNMGNFWQRDFTVPMSKLEKQGLTRDVPITIDYDLDVKSERFSRKPLIGPSPPEPGPKPDPGPDPKPDKEFPRSGPAKTTGSLLRVRSGPGFQYPALRLLGNRGTPIHVQTQVRDGNDVWDQVAGGWVSHRFVAFDADAA